VIYLHTKFQVSSFSHSGDIEGVPKFKCRSRDLGHALLSLTVNHYVTFHLLDISVKFCDDSFIDCQEICKNALHWIMLEVLPKKRFLGYKWGAVDP